MLMAVGVKVAETERLLMAQCRAGDLDAFEQVYRQYTDVVFRHAFYLLGHHEDADDIKQETFLRAFRALQGFRQDSSLLTWLLKICSNLCYDRLKRRQRQPEIAYNAESVQRYFRESPDAANHLMDPQAVLDRADTLQLLLQALQNMPPTTAQPDSPPLAGRSGLQRDRTGAWLCARRLLSISSRQLWSMPGWPGKCGSASKRLPSQSYVSSFRKRPVLS